jgi:hypothetical protein
MNRQETVLPVCVGGRMLAQGYRKISGKRNRTTSVTRPWEVTWVCADYLVVEAVS